MATFTMNSQKNFVQSPPSQGIFDKAFAFSVVLVVIVGGIWATERVLIYLADKQIAEYQAQTAESFASVSAEDAQAVHDVTSRLGTVQKYANTSPTLNSQEILATLESSTIPQAKLTEYEHKSDGRVTIKGTVTDYRFLAEQILRYRQQALFATAEVESTERTEGGKINFVLSVESPAEETPAAPVPAAMPI